MMFKMIEVVGVSPDSFSKATKEAVDQVTQSGSTVHFFEVVEQRGAVKQGKVKEYQVKVKVAVEVEVPNQKIVIKEDDSNKEQKIVIKEDDSNKEQKIKVEKNVCPTCMTTADEKGHLCVPTTTKDEKCEWCGSLIVNERHLCNDKVKQLSFVCNSCGRTAVNPKHLCHPKKI